MKWSVYSVLLVTLLLIVDPAWARAPRPARARTQPTKVQAKKLFAQANKLVRTRQYAAAIQAFKKAYALWQHPTILYNMALAHAFGGQPVEATRQARRYLKKRPLRPGKRLPKVLRQAMARTGLLVIQLPDPKASIYVDGRLSGRGKAEVVVLAGRRAIDVRIKDRVVARTIIMVHAGKEKMWELAAIPRPRPRPRPRARPRTQPRPRPRHGPQPRQVVPGVRPTSKSTAPKGLHWAYLTTTASLTVASLAAAITFSVLTKSAYDDNVAHPSPASKDRGERLQLTANALWGVTGAMALTAVMLSIFTRYKAPERSERQTQSKPQTQTQITITPFRAGMGLSVTW